MLSPFIPVSLFLPALRLGLPETPDGIARLNPSDERTEPLPSRSLPVLAQRTPHTVEQSVA